MRRLFLFFLLPLTVVCAQQTGVQPASALAVPSGLESALRAAMQAHPSVLGKRAELRAKQAAADSVRAQRYPSLSVQAQQGVGTAAGTTANAVRLRQPVWAFGRLDDALAVAEADVGGERLDLLRVQRQLLENTALAYARVLTAHDRLAIGQASHQAQVGWLDQIRRRERGQVASAADVRLAVVRLAQAQAQAERLGAERTQAIDDLQALVVNPVGWQVPLDRALLRPMDLESLEALAPVASADVQYRAQLVERARAQLAQTRSAAMPTIYAQLERSTSDAANAASRSPRLSLVFEVALDGLGQSLRGNIAQAEATVDAAHEALQGARRDVARLTRSYWNSHHALLQVIKAHQESSGDMALLLTSYRRQYEAGTKSWLEVLNMQRELSEQQLQNAQAEGDAYAYALRLQTLMARLDDAAGLIKDKQ